MESNFDNAIMYNTTFVFWQRAFVLKNLELEKWINSHKNLTVLNIQLAPIQHSSYLLAYKIFSI